MLIYSFLFQADVLVNSSNTSLQLANGAVSKSIVEHGGPTLQEECKQKYPKGINMGDIAVTGPGKLPYVQNVYHVCLPDFDKNGEKVIIIYTLFHEKLSKFFFEYYRFAKT